MCGQWAASPSATEAAIPSGYERYSRSVAPSGRNGWKADVTARHSLLHLDGDEGRCRVQDNSSCSYAPLSSRSCCISDGRLWNEPQARPCVSVADRLTRRKSPLKPLLSALNCRTLIACQCRRRKLPPAQIELVPRSGVLEGGLRLALCSEKHGTQVSSKRERPVFNSLLRRAVFFR